MSIGSVSILRNVNMELPAGKFTGLIGRNGAGKTTLMRSIMGILKPRNGSIHFDGTTLDSLPTHQRARAGIGYMPEDRRLVPNLYGRGERADAGLGRAAARRARRGSPRSTR